MSAPLPLDKIRDVERLNLEPGDALAFIVSEDTTRDQAHDINRYLADVLPGVRCLIVSGAKLQVVSQRVADVIDPPGSTEHPTAG